MSAGRLAKSLDVHGQFFLHVHVSLPFDVLQEKRLSGHGPLESSQVLTIGEEVRSFSNPYHCGRGYRRQKSVQTSLK